MNESIRRFLVTVVSCSVAAAVSHAAMVKVPVSLRGGLPPDKKFLAATCVLTPTGDHASSLQKMSVPLEVPGLGGFDMPKGTWMMEVVVPGYWHPPAIVHLNDRDETVEFRLWPTATIHGTIKVKKGDPMPPEISIRFQSPPSVGTADRLPVTQIRCPIQDGAWSCEVPAGLLDLRFHARHFLSEYRWKFPLAVGANVDLGTFVLRRGSSVIGNVELAPRLKALDKETRIILHPRSFGAPADDRGRDSMRVLAATANDRGFFAIEGVPPGEYTILAQQKDLTSLPQPVRVLEDAEVELLEPLILYPPRTLTLHVMPEVDPDGTPWHIRLYAEAGPSGRVDVIAEDSLSREGTWHQGGLHGSRYTVALRTSSGAKWLNESFDLPDESNIINLQIPLVKVRGMLKLGEHPVAAKIYFGGQSGSTSIPLESDDKGVFTGVLPKRDDPWSEVTVVATLPAVSRTLRDVKVVASSGDGEANVDLILPSTYIAGNVVDAEGRPVQRAIVNVQNTAHEPFVQVFAENDGSFEINGLPTGAVTLQASAYLQESNALDVSLTEGETTRVKLILKPTAILAGRVLSPIGPVAGARVIAMPTDVTSLATVPVTTDANGEFACPMAAGARQVDFTVEAPGFAYKMFHLMVTDKGINVPLDQAGGTLVVDAPPFDGADVSTLPFLIHAGARRALPYIGRPAFEKTDRGYRIRVPMLERGEYQVCIGTTDRCSSGFLPPFGELSLVLPTNN